MMSLAQSAQLLDESRRYLAGGVSSNVRLAAQPPPLFFTHGNGPRLYDADGNVYIDYVLGQGPMLLGHTPAPVIKAVQEAVARGQLYGGQHELEISVARAVTELVPCAELVRFGSSGTEVVQAALRVARAHTGRRRVLKFEGHYHGWLDNILVSFHPTPAEAGPRQGPNVVPVTAGQPPAAYSDTMTLPWNDSALLEQTIERHKDELAAVIMEPMMCNTGAILPAEGYLQAARTVCSRFGVVLIFDEIITGFRLSLAGAQGLFGVTPDLALFGKAMASGFPVACLAGKEALMRGIAQGRVNHSGTYNSNVTSMAAAWATLQELQRDDGAVYKRLYSLGDRLKEGICRASAAAGASILVQGLGPVFHIGFSALASVTDYRTALSYDEPRYLRLCGALLARGVRLTGRGIVYVSAAHAADDIETTVAAFRGALAAG